MLKERYKLWVIIIIASFIVQFVVHTAGPTLVRGIHSWAEEYNQKHEQMTSEKESTPVDEYEEVVIVNKLFSIISTTSKSVGVMVMLFGTMTFIVAFVQENPEALHRGISNMTMGGALLGLSFIIPILGDVSTVKDTENQAVASTTMDETEHILTD